MQGGSWGTPQFRSVSGECHLLCTSVVTWYIFDWSKMFKNVKTQFQQRCSETNALLEENLTYTHTLLGYVAGQIKNV